MSGLANRVVSIITGGRGAPAPGGTFREQADALRARAGSLNAAARLAGVDRRTYQRWYERWNAGKEPRPRPGTADRLAEGTRRAQLDPGRPGERDVSLNVVDRGRPGSRNPGGRERTLTGDNLKLRAGTMDAVRDAWVRTGDPEAAAAAFLAGVTVPFYKRWLTPPSSDRNPAPQAPGPSAGVDFGGAGGGDGGGAGGAGGGAGGAGGGARGGDDEDEDEDDDEDAGPDAWDEFYEDVYDEYPDMDEGYGGDVT